MWINGGPVFAKQQRVGRGGHVFRPLVLRTRGEGTASERQPISIFGRFLEESQLAALPQLWNVLVGEMSIVGPCAASLREAGFYRNKVPNYELRQSVRPGITGYAQVYLRSASPSTRIEYDLHYVRHMGAALDFMIVWHSLILRRERHKHFS